MPDFNSSRFNWKSGLSVRGLWYSYFNSSRFNWKLQHFLKMKVEFYFNSSRFNWKYGRSNEVRFNSLFQFQQVQLEVPCEKMPVCPLFNFNSSRFNWKFRLNTFQATLELYFNSSRFNWKLLLALQIHLLSLISIPVGSIGSLSP